MVSNNSQYGSSGVREGFNDYEKVVLDVVTLSLGNYLGKLDYGDNYTSSLV
ncbi:hypothetical protein SESBI_09007 [Sesbania bispinosa]|nr:hypothetical protein SESBI_09007 [Sesbania bispinosa]